MGKSYDKSDELNNAIEKQLREDHAQVVKEMLKKSKKGALSLAVAFTISTTVTGCNNLNKPEDASYYVGNSRSFNQVDPSESSNSGNMPVYHYYGGGSYYYGRGATYRSGSWGTFSSIDSSKSGGVSKSSGSTIKSKSGLGGSSYTGAGG